MIIYKTTNKINGKFYIGKDAKNNPNYLGSGQLLHKAIKKYGVENFEKEILEYCTDKKHMNEREIFWINITDAQKLGYNIADGGHGGNTYTEETKQRISRLYKNRYIAPETIEKRKITRSKNPEKYKLSEERKKIIGDQHRGKIISDKQKKLTSERMKKFDNYSEKFLLQQKSENKIGEKNPMWGKQASVETRKKQSESHKKNPSRYWLGKKQPKEFVEKRIAPLRGRKWSQDRRDKYTVNPFAGKKHSAESIQKMKNSKKNKTPEQKLDTYIKFYISRCGNEPTEEQKNKKLHYYKENS